MQYDIMDIVIREPEYLLKGITKEDKSITKLANDLKLDKHPNGGYFKETDRSKKEILVNKNDNKLLINRNQSTLIHFLMNCESPIGKFHTNEISRTIHILQKGHGIYILIHKDGIIEKFKVGFNVSNGERTQWIVEPGVYKGCYLVPDDDDGDGDNESNKDCLWVSEIVIPGFDFQDMKFLDFEKLCNLVGNEKANNLKFLL